MDRGLLHLTMPMLTLNFSPFPKIVTERLTLRVIDMGDVEALFSLRSDERVMRYIGRPKAKEKSDSIELIERNIQDLKENTSISWAISLKDDHTLIGTIGYYRIKLEHHRGEVGYALHPDHWGKGIMCEALNAVTEVGFQQFGFHSIEGVTDPLNHASNRLLQRCGFIREGILKENYFWNGKFLDSAVYSKLAPKQ